MVRKKQDLIFDKQVCRTTLSVMYDFGEFRLRIIHVIGTIISMSQSHSHYIKKLNKISYTYNLCAYKYNYDARTEHIVSFGPCSNIFKVPGAGPKSSTRQRVNVSTFALKTIHLLSIQLLINDLMSK